MSTPDQQPTPSDTPTADSTELATAQHREVLATLYQHATNPTRTTRVISWAGWHLGELAGVTLPLGLALTAWDGFYAVSGLAALAWAVHEYRLHRKDRAIRATRPAPTGNTPPGSDEDGEVGA